MCLFLLIVGSVPCVTIGYYMKVDRQASNVDNVPVFAPLIIHLRATLGYVRGELRNMARDARHTRLRRRIRILLRPLGFS